MFETIVNEILDATTADALARAECHYDIDASQGAITEDQRIALARINDLVGARITIAHLAARLDA